MPIYVYTIGLSFVSFMLGFYLGYVESRYYERKYLELLMAVERKFPGETLHQTALRYIQEAETQSTEGGNDQAEPLRGFQYGGKP